MFTGLVVTNYPIRYLPSTGPYVGSAEVVPVLTRSFPVEVDGLAFEYLAVSAGHLHDFAGSGLWDAISPEMAEMHPTAARSVWGLDDSPPLVAIPIPHCAY